MKSVSLNRDVMKELIDSHLAGLIPERPTLIHAPLFAAARYALSGGKRLRPVLALTTAHAYGFPVEKALTAACCLELVHTYSLIHDDLPSMDDDDMRRNRPSLHRVFQEGQAVLTGDFLLTYAFELLATCPLDATQRIALISELSRAAGSEGMVGGQFADITLNLPKLPEEKLLFIYSKKTAALIACSLVFGGICAQVSHQQIEILRSMGTSLGIAFQFADDLADQTLEFDKQRIEQLIQDHLEKALKQLRAFSGDPTQLELLFHQLCSL